MKKKTAKEGYPNRSFKPIMDDSFYGGSDPFHKMSEECVGSLEMFEAARPKWTGLKYDIISVKINGKALSVGDVVYHVDGSYSVRIAKFVVPNLPCVPNEDVLWFIDEDNACRDLRNFKL